MAEKPEGKKDDRDWSTRVGVIKAGSLETFKTKDDKDALRALVVNAEGKESIVEAFSEAAQTKLKEVAGSDKPHVFRGPAYFTQGNVAHVMVATVREQGEPTAKKSPEELEAAKAGRAEAGRARAADRDASRVLVEAGSVDLGGKVEKDGASHEVNFIGATFDKDGKSFAYAYFGQMGAEMAERAAEKAKEEEPAGPGM
ncbi:hypothetical protein [Defluviimonas salinarum]|uniref:Uncharacterized protein n=1 Tax=Defluviimonas salinarum TaxID=2992147 RepID=A0ABT3J5K9_9RHOB|nr:hypothetical protein [Defluviimonas salinarum]MCW3782975.1 hypothetical protein [Defluviimonas salinarum]